MGKYKRQKSGLYRTTIQIGYDADGKPIKKYLSAPTIKELEKKNKNVAYNIFKSSENVNIDTVLATKKDGVKTFFLENYNKDNE